MREAFQKQESKTYRERSSESLRSRWGTLQRNVQKYIAAERVYLSKLVSGETSLDAEPNIMKLYCSHNRRKDAYGIVLGGAPLRSLEAVAVLRDCPKFGAKSESNSQNSEADKFTPDANSDPYDKRQQHNGNGEINAVLKSKNVAKTRPGGVKYVKSTFKTKAQHGFSSLSKAMEGKNIVKRDELRLKYISELPGQRDENEFTLGVS